MKHTGKKRESMRSLAKSNIKKWNSEWASRGYALSPMDISADEIYERLKLRQERGK
jgi:hypothetical protein